MNMQTRDSTHIQLERLHSNGT